MAGEKHCAASIRTEAPGQKGEEFLRQRTKTQLDSASHAVDFVLQPRVTLPSVSFRSVLSVFTRYHVGQYPIPVASQPE